MTSANGFGPKIRMDQVGGPENTPTDIESQRAKAVVELREQLEAASRCFTDVSDGAGTMYAFDGVSAGVGFAAGSILVQGDGRVSVWLSSGILIPKEQRHDVRKLLRLYDEQFIVSGLKLDEGGELVFEPDPLDLAALDMTVPDVVDCACGVMHAYAGIPLALAAGAEPWALMDYRHIEDVDTGTVDAAPDVPASPAAEANAFDSAGEDIPIPILRSLLDSVLSGD